MTYVMSDIHGHYDKYRRMLDIICFSEEDALYILGDLIDCGPQSMEVVLDAMARKNVCCTMGNHEEGILSTLRNIVYGNDSTARNPLYAFFGRMDTVKAFQKLDDANRRKVLDYLSTLPLYRRLNIQGQKYTFWRMLFRPRREC